MKKFGLFTNFQFDDNLYRIYQDGIKSAIGKRIRSGEELQVELVNVMPQGELFTSANPVVNTSLFESCFHSSLEFGANVQRCDVIALAVHDTYLHSIAEEVYLEHRDEYPDAQYISLAQCAVAACNRHKRITRPGMLCVNNVEHDLYTLNCFAESGYPLVNVFEPDLITELNSRAAMVLGQNPNVEELRFICSTVEAAAKVSNINGLLSVGYLELCQVLNQGGVRFPVISLVEEHINAIAKAILS